MIAVSSSGESFIKLADYLIHERADGIERVAWSTTRNLPTEDIPLAAEFMRATAAANPRVEEPVFHLAISFHPDDKVDRAMMEGVADRVLKELKLTEHQTVIVAHGDTAHPHMHLMVNRIHPETGRAWDRWHERTITQRVLRQEERALGLREVRGHLYHLDPHTQVPEHARTTSGEHREAVRKGVEPLVERVRADASQLRAADSWDSLHAQLAERGLRIERKGQGAVITDGEHQVKASRVHRDLSFGQLMQRLGEFREHRQDLGIAADRPRDADVRPTVDKSTERADASDRIAEAARLARLAEHRDRLRGIEYRAESVHSAARATAQHFEWTRPPQRSPEQHAADDRTQAQLRARAQHTERRLHRVREAHSRLPSAATLDRLLARAVLALTPPELRGFVLAVTDPQRALAMKITDTVRAAVLGREQGIER
jgi:hypothetical protein